VVWPAGVKDVGWRPGRAARPRVWPCPSPSRIFDRYAAASPSLTASLQHGIGRWRGRQGACLRNRRAALYNELVEPVLACHMRATLYCRSGLARR
jgi:hypothetical protein